MLSLSQHSAAVETQSRDLPQGQSPEPASPFHRSVAENTWFPLYLQAQENKENNEQYPFLQSCKLPLSVLAYDVHSNILWLLWANILQGYIHRETQWFIVWMLCLWKELSKVIIWVCPEMANGHSSLLWLWLSTFVFVSVSLSRNVETATVQRTKQYCQRKVAATSATSHWLRASCFCFKHLGIYSCYSCFSYFLFVNFLDLGNIFSIGMCPSWSIILEVVWVLLG